MGKRSDFERNSRDYYPTPLKAVYSLAPFLNGKKYIEPCAGDGRLIEHIRLLQPNATCVAACDIEPQKDEVIGVKIFQKNILEDFKTDVASFADMFVTNPPWINNKESGYQLNAIIEKLSSILPTWLLLNGNYCFNKKSARFMRMCTDVIPVGRLKWIEDSPHTGKEDVAWFRFDNTTDDTKLTYIHPRKD